MKITSVETRFIETIFRYGEFKFSPPDFTPGPGPTSRMLPPNNMREDTVRYYIDLSDSIDRGINQKIFCKRHWSCETYLNYELLFKNFQIFYDLPILNRIQFQKYYNSSQQHLQHMQPSHHPRHHHSRMAMQHQQQQHHVSID